MDCSAIVLNKLLAGRDVEIWAKLKLTFLDAAYASLYSAISRHYEKHGVIPSFEELELSLREGATTRTLAAVKLVDEPDISGEVALAALIDQYTQNLAISMLDKFIDKLPVYDTNEVKQEVARMAMELDEKTLTSEGVYLQSDIFLFQSQEEITKDRVPLGFNNKFDATLGGIARQEYVLIGGRRGSGKSIVGHNIVINEYEAGATSAMFTIEMKGREINERIYASLAGVRYAGLKKGDLTQEEWLKVVSTRASMFKDSSYLLDEYLSHRDRFKFEQDLVRHCKLKDDNQIIIIDDSKLTIPTIDLHLGKLKAKFKDSLRVVVVDYINQIKIEGSNQYDWQPQIEVSTRLKDLARKYDVVMVSPYQIDATGEARFAKGILDSADIAALINSSDKDSGIISFETTKVRGGPEIKSGSRIDWDTLRIYPESIDIENVKHAEDADSKPTKRKFGKKVKADVLDDSKSDIPWDA